MFCRAFLSLADTNNQDTDLGDTYSKFAAHGCPEARQKQILEFLRACYNNKDYAHVLHQLLFFPEQPW